MTLFLSEQDVHSFLSMNDVVGGKAHPSGRNLFKSNGVAIEDVATASLVYDRALKVGGFSESKFGF